MPNKPVNHTDLDNAVKSSLLNTPAEAKVEWEEINNMLPKKSTVVRGPLADIGFSLNSFAGVAAAGTSAKLKSAVLFAKRWSFSLYVAAGSILLGTGAYLIYGSLSKNTSAKSESIIAPVKETVKPQENPAAQQNPIVNTVSTPETTTSTEDSSFVDFKGSGRISSSPEPCALINGGGLL